MSKIPGGRAFELAEVEAFLRDKRIGPLEGFRSKAGWPFTAELKLVRDDEIDNWKLEFDFGEDAKREGESGEPVDFSGQEPLGRCPKTQGNVYEFGANYVCEHSVGPATSCDFKSGKVILQQPVAREQMTKLLATGATDLLDGFVSNKTRRKFKARLAWDAKESKVVFAFEPRPERRPAAKKAAGAAKAAAPAAPQVDAGPKVDAALAVDAVPGKKAPARKVTAVRKVAVKTAAKTAARKTAAKNPA
jgi:DNA topoisomerase-3